MIRYYIYYNLTLLYKNKLIEICITEWRQQKQLFVSCEK